MKISVANNPAFGQTSLEYLLLLAVVAVVVIASFRPGALISRVHDAAGGYYNSVTRVIMGENPAKIDGGWCGITCPAAGPTGFPIMYGSCACPQPAFGGAYRPGAGQTVPCAPGNTCYGAVIQCSGSTICTCPNGPCDASGQCACKLDCSSIPNSSPDPTCTKCDCYSGTYWSGHSCVSCSQPCTTYNGNMACVPVQCGANMYCDPTLPVSQNCACYAGTYWNGSACVSCPDAIL